MSVYLCCVFDGIRENGKYTSEMWAELHANLCTKRSAAYQLRMHRVAYDEMRKHRDGSMETKIHVDIEC